MVFIVLATYLLKNIRASWCLLAKDLSNRPLPTDRRAVEHRRAMHTDELSSALNRTAKLWGRFSSVERSIVNLNVYRTRNILKHLVITVEMKFSLVCCILDAFQRVLDIFLANVFISFEIFFEDFFHYGKLFWGKSCKCNFKLTHNITRAIERSFPINGCTRSSGASDPFNLNGNLVLLQEELLLLTNSF